MALKPGTPETAALAREGRARRHRERMALAADLRGRGYSWKEIAVRLGVKDVRGLAYRVRKHCEVEEAPVTREVVLSVLDEVREKLDEIRRRYE